MTSYIIKRLLLLIPTLLIVTIIVFALVHLVPGDAVDVIEASLQTQQGDVSLDRAAIEHALGLDVPAHIRYVRWIGNVFLHGDLGTSIIQDKPVLDMIMHRIPVTFELGLLALIISVLMNLAIGIYSAVRQDTFFDYAGRTVAIVMMAMPIFWLGILVMIYPSIWWGWSPPVEYVPFTEDPIGNLGMLLIPAVILGTGNAGLMRITRTMMLEVMRQDYIKTAWAKGLSERAVIFKHGIKNAFIPVITVIGAQVGTLIGGTVIIENIFCLPGMGQLALLALNQRDFYLVSAITLITSAFVMVVNLVVDLTYSWLDPRIRYQ